MGWISLVFRPMPRTWRSSSGHREVNVILIEGAEKGPDLLVLAVSIEEGRHSNIPGIQTNRWPAHLLDSRVKDLIILPIQDQARVLKLQGSSIELILVGRGHPYHGVLGVADHTLYSVA